MVKKAKLDLEQTGTKFLGVILNKVSIKELGYGGYRKLSETTGNNNNNNNKDAGEK